MIELTFGGVSFDNPITQFVIQIIIEQQLKIK